MKNKRIFLKKCLLLACCCFVVLGCKDNDNIINDSGDVKLKRCNTGTEFSTDYSEEIVLLFRPGSADNASRIRESLEIGQRYMFISDTSGHLSMNTPLPRVSSLICNFPKELAEWDIPSSGLPVLVRGRIYDYDAHSSGDLIMSYIELTYIKKL